MIVLITGGSSGLGEAITRKLAENSDNRIYFTYNNSAEKASLIVASYINAEAIRCNFNDDKDVDHLTETIPSLNIDLLINNAYAGAFTKTHFHKTHPDEFLTEFKKNIVPTLRISQAAINLFRKKKQGKIITILSAALVNVAPAGAAVYVANKAYLEKMTKVWATENARYNITSNTVSPSFMQTNFTRDTDERMVEQMTDGHPLKRILSTTEAADAVVFLSLAPDHINGIDILINSALNIR